MAGRTFTPIQCGECGGTYSPTGAAYEYMCNVCEHRVTSGDISCNLEPGEQMGHSRVLGTLVLGYWS